MTGSRPGGSGWAGVGGQTPSASRRGEDIFVVGHSRLWDRVAARLRPRPPAPRPTGAAWTRPLPPATSPWHDVDGSAETSRIAQRRLFEADALSASTTPAAAGSVPPRVLPPPPVLGGMRRAASPPRPAPAGGVDAPTVLSLFAAPLTPLRALGVFDGAPDAVDG